MDHSATTPVDPRVAEVVHNVMVNLFGNPSSVHSFGREAKGLLHQARERVARLINAQPEEIYFTSGGTEADNLALLGYAEANRSRGDRILISNIEHPAIRNASRELRRRGFRVEEIPADPYGMIQPDRVAQMVDSSTILVSIMHVNNEVGTINDIAAISEVVHRKGVCFHTDAVQSYGKIPIDVKAWGIDMLSLSGHKIYGPKGVGALFVRKGLELHPLLFGGHQEEGLRAGTENMPGIVGLGEAALLCQQMMSYEEERLTQLRLRLWHQISSKLPWIRLNGHPSCRLPGNLNLTFLGVEGEALLIALDLEGVAVSSGSACSSGSHQPSPVLLALGLTPEEAQSTLRITLGRGNTEEEVDRVAEIIVKTASRLREVAGVKEGVAVSS